MKVLIIGFGNMGQTYASSFTSSGFICSKDVIVLNRSEVEKKKRFSVEKSNFYTEPSKSIFDVDIIILAVKPQDFLTLASSIKPFVTKEHIILSVMAGISMQSIQDKFDVNKVVRSMPNIPTQIGQGMTVFCASSDIDRKDLFIVQNLINTTGKSIYVDKEEMINAATAISGSGPAYVYYFMNAMVESAIELGFSTSEAEFLVGQTFTGAVQLQNRSKESHQQWIDKVSSKGGTTEAALAIFNKYNLNDNISEALYAANQKAIELGV
ncbi:pyrroline-5-carboxylate reductase [Flavobacterium sp.]|jgi:pyrroline-5-carboxylate reductase|uniref:pyrroline-5-carboxylate reductase n=1 Tax=Flavobacterium sp. TaxID=239 RepID=UPI002A7FE580|nr:pyrroline-5-carboxylate reductase [Flavobacterium sp.]